MRKNNNSIYADPQFTTALENGDETYITQARKNYWKEYKRKWRKNKRRDEKEFVISFTKEELLILSAEAKRHSLSRTGFIKKSMFAYLDKRYITPNEKEVRLIRQHLAMLDNLFVDQCEQSLITKNNCEHLVGLVENTEKEILILLHNPRSLEQWIIETIHQKPHYLHVLRNLVSQFEAYDPQESKS